MFGVTNIGSNYAKQILGNSLQAKTSYDFTCVGTQWKPKIVVGIPWGSEILNI
jgi:hypothetical protein